MKKLLLLITGLLLLFSVEGQILRYSNYTTPIPSEILVTSIDVWGTGGATTISTNGGTLQMLKKTLPTNAADTTVTWSRTNGTGTADISAGGLLTALTNGTVTVRATANDGSGIYGEVQITISNQVGPIAMSTAELGTYNDSIILTIWDRNLHQDSIPPTSAFALTEDSNTFGIEAITINEDSLFIALDSTGAYGSTYLLSYTPGYPAIQDSSENNAVSFSGQAVTNNIEEPAGEATLGDDIIDGMGSFDSATGWDVNDWTISSGVATCNMTRFAGLVILSLPTAWTTETEYRIEFDIVATGGNIELAFTYQGGSDLDLIPEDFYTTGSYSFDFTSPATIPAQRLEIYNLDESTASSVTIDNLTIRPIL